MAEIMHYLLTYEDIPCSSDIVWLTEHDCDKLNEHLVLCGQKPMKKRRYRKIYREGLARYCLLYIDGVPAARGAIEPYSERCWEAADIRVAREYRCRGLAKEILRFLSPMIIAEGKIATCRTEEHNIAMQKAMRAVGYVRGEPPVSLNKGESS